MKPGSVIIDMAASTGGNCEGSKNNETVIVNGVRLIGNSSLASTIPADASKMFGKNMVNFLKLMISNASLQLNFNDDLIQGCCITHAGEIVNARIKETYSTQPA
jgi:NAD(P) transhydrogenase subunit alpha